MGMFRGRQLQRQMSKKTNVLASRVVTVGATTAIFGLTAGVFPLPSIGSFTPNLMTAAYADRMSDVGSKSVTLDIAAADLHEVVHMLQTQTGADIVIRDGKEPFSRVNVSLRSRPLDVVLKLIATSADAQLTRDDNGVYIFTPLSDGRMTPQVASTQTAMVPAAAPAANMHWQKLVLQHAVPHDVLFLMHWDQGYREIDPFSNNRYQETNRDVSTPVSPLQIVGNNGVTQFPSVPIERGVAGQSSVNDYANSANRSIDGSDETQAHQFPGGGFGGGGGGFGGGGGAIGGGGAAGGGAAGGAGGLTSTSVSAQLPPGVDKIYALQSDNSLLILSTPEGFQAVKEIIKNLDISPRQVEIKAEFVSVRVNDQDQLGVSFSLVPVPGVTASTTLAQPIPGTFNLQYAAGNVAATLAANLKKERVKTVQAPMITTTNNVTGSVFVRNEIPYTTTQTIIPGGGNTAVTNNVAQTLQITTGISVTPRINSDDTITLYLQPQVSTPGVGATAGGRPAVTTQTVTTLRTIRNGETMVLGGLISKTESRIQNRVPFFGDLPIIGNLFRDRNVAIDDTELLIFITATIIGEETQNGQAGGVSP